MRRINEGTAVELSVARRGDDGSLVTPTSLKYKVDCETSGTAITAWTTLTPASITAIAIPATSNAIQDDSNPYEDKVVTVMANAGLSTQEVTEQRYRVENLGGIS